VTDLSDLRECEAAARHAPTNGAAVGSSLGYVRDRRLWRAGGFGSWDEYVERALGVPLALAEAAIDGYGEWRLGTWRTHRDYLARLAAAMHAVADAGVREQAEAREACRAPRTPPPEVWGELAAACASLQTVLDDGDEAVEPAEPEDFTGPAEAGEDVNHTEGLF
jgi:hypothetical protein